MGFLIHIPSSPRLGNGYAKGHTRFLKIRTTLNAEHGDARPRYAPGGRKRVISSERGSFAAVRGNTAGTVSSWTFKVSERGLRRDVANAELTIHSYTGFPINLYDVRESCDRSPDKDGPLCYKELQWVPIWLNDKDVKSELGANPTINFTIASEKVEEDFLSSGDLMYYSAGLLTDLINDGIRLLVYAGDTGTLGSARLFRSVAHDLADGACNVLGQSRWVEKLPSIFRNEYAQALTLAWRAKSSGGVVGTVRTVGGGGETAGNITFVTIHEAGHMAPYDKPAETLVRQPPHSSLGSFPD